MANLPSKQWVWDRAIDIAGVVMVYALWCRVVREWDAVQALIERGM